MSKKNPTKEELRSSAYESKLEDVRLVELQARFWKANYELKHYYLLDKGIQSEYAESVSKEMQEYAKAQENSIRELSPEEAAGLTPVNEN